MPKKVFVGMSGGVDSSVAALLLVQQGYDVTGVYMKNWSEDLPGMQCPWAEDLADAKRVAVRLGIDFAIWDFEAEYRQHVVDYLLRESRAGRTPNPDIICNQEIKFKLFLERALAAGADYIATGHYAQRLPAPPSSAPDVNHLPPSNTTRKPRTAAPLNPTIAASSTPALLGRATNSSATTDSPLPTPALLGRAVDENKDQTYFLYRISQTALDHTLFPLGQLRKPAVKQLAAAAGLPNAYKKESMGLCFVGDVNLRDFLQHYLAPQPGEIREIESDRVLGTHDGAIFYTIGQRHGLYLSGLAGEANSGLPYYVVAKDLPRNLVYVSRNLNHPALWTTELSLSDVIWHHQPLTPPPASPSTPPTSASPTSTQTTSHQAAPTSLTASSTSTSPASAQTTSHQAAPTSLTASSTSASPASTQTSPLQASPLPSPASPQAVLVRLRHRGELIPAQFDGTKVTFPQPVRRPASGQSAVFYNARFCLGGGIIT